MHKQSGFSRFAEFMPGKPVSNDQLPVVYENIVGRTGIKSRHIAAREDTEVSIGIEAARNLFHQLNLKAGDIDGLVFSTCTMNEKTPHELHNAAKSVAAALSIRGPAVGLNFACSGFPAAVEQALRLREGTDKHIAIITAEIMSKITNWKNEATAVLFGDNATATTIGDGGHEVLQAAAWEVQDEQELIHLEKMRDAMDAQGVISERVCIAMNGRPLFKRAPGEMVSLAMTFMESMHLTPDDVSAIVPHQANGRFMQKIKEILQDKYGEIFEKVWIVNEIEQRGNVASSSIPSALARMQDNLLPGKVVVCPAIGAGPGFHRGTLTQGILAFRVAGARM